MWDARDPRVIRLVVTGLAALAIGLQFYGLYRPAAPPGASSFPGEDKLQHLLGFALPVFLVLLAVGRLSLVVPLVFAAHAVLSEVAQWAWYVHRDGDVRDVLADLVGIAAGCAAFALVDRRRRGRLERPA